MKSAKISTKALPPTKKIELKVPIAGSKAVSTKELAGSNHNETLLRS